MFQKTCYLLEELAAADNNHTCFKKPFFFYSNDREQELIKYLFRKSLNIYDGTDGDDGSMLLELVELLDVSYEDKTQLLGDIHSISRPFEDQEKRFMKKLELALGKFLEKIEKDEGASNEENVMRTSLCFPYQINDSSYFVVRRLLQLRQFAFNKQKDSSYFPTLAQTIDTSEFDGLDRYELANLFSKENFYNLSQQQLQALLQATANNFLIENGTSSCAVLIEDLPVQDGAITFGEYDPNRGAIIMNKKIINLFQTAKSQNMQSYAYHMLSTLIHEATHRVQFANLSKTNLPLKDAVVVQALKDPEFRSSYAEYLSAPEELDARQSALEYIKDCGQALSNPAMLGFYNVVLDHEKNNSKAEVNGQIKQLFSTIYSQALLEGAKNLTRDHEKYRRLLSQTANELSK